MSLKVSRHDNQQRVIINTWANGTIDATKDVMSVGTSKDVAGVGTFNLMLFAKPDYLRYVRPDDWVEVYLSRDGAEELVCYGPVGRISRRRRGTSNGVTERIALMGQDFTKAFMQTEVFFDSLNGYVTSASFAQRTAQANQQLGPLTPGSVLQLLMRAFLGGGDGSPQFWLPGGSQSLATILDVTSKLDLNVGGRLALSDFDALPGNLWAAMEGYADRLNNYLYCDVIKKSGGPLGKQWQPAVFFGQLPFSDNAFDNLPLSTLDAATDVRSEDIGYAEQDVKNWVRLFPDVFSHKEDGLALATGPWVNALSIKKHGIRRFESNTPYSLPPSRGVVPDSNSQAGDVITQLTEQVKRVSGWYNRNEIMLNGTIECSFRPDIRVNTRLEYRDTFTGDVLKFYVEAVEHTWNFNPPEATTSIHVTRGYAPGTLWEKTKAAQDAANTFAGMRGG